MPENTYATSGQSTAAVPRFPRTAAPDTLRRVVFAALQSHRDTDKPHPRDLPPTYTPPPQTQPPPGDLSVLTQQFPVVHTDDDEDMCRFVSLVLQRGGLRVVSVFSGEEAIAVCTRTPVSLLVTDIMKPEMNGFELVHRLHANPVTRHIPVVFLSARCALSDQAKGYQLGAVGYLTKPVFPDELLTSVQGALARYGNWCAPPTLDAALMRRLAGHDDVPDDMQ